MCTAARPPCLQVGRGAAFASSGSNHGTTGSNHGSNRATDLPSRPSSLCTSDRRWRSLRLRWDAGGERGLVFWPLRCGFGIVLAFTRAPRARKLDRSAVLHVCPRCALCVPLRRVRKDNVLRTRLNGIFAYVLYWYMNSCLFTHSNYGEIELNSTDNSSVIPSHCSP